MSKIFVKLTGLIAVLVAVSMLLTGCSSFEGELSKAIEAYISGDAEAVAEMYSFQEDYAELTGSSEFDLEEETEKWETKIDNFKDAVETYFEADFEDVAIDYEITEYETVDDLEDDEREQFDTYTEMVEDSLDISISDSANVEFIITLEYDGEEEKIEGSSVLMKLDGSWRLNSFSVSYYDLNN